MVQNIKCKKSLKLRVFRVNHEGQTTAQRKRTKGQTIQQPKEKGQKDKQRSINNTHKTKDRVK